MDTSKKVCNTCGGSGEIGFFQGESRFFITREECPACYGFGYEPEDNETGQANDAQAEEGIDEGEKKP